MISPSRNPQSWLRAANAHARTFWKWLIEPPASVHDPAHRRQARMLSTFLLVILSLLLISLPLGRLIPEYPLGRLAVEAALLGIAFGLSRTRYYYASATFAIIDLAVFPLMILNSPGSRPDDVLMWTALAVLLSVVLLPPYGPAAVGLTVALEMLLVRWLFPAITDLDILNPLIFIATLSVLSTVFSRHRALLERDRRVELEAANEQLEARVAERARALQESDARFRTITEEALVGVYVIQEGVFRYVNPTFGDIFNYRPEEIVNRLTPSDLTFADDRPLVEENVRRRVTGEIPTVHYQFRGLRKNGQVIACEVLGRTVDLQGGPAIVGMVLDVSERKKAEESEREQRVLAEALRDNAALLNGTLYEDEVLDRLLDNVGRAIEQDALEIMLIEDGVASIVRSRGYAGRTPQETLNEYRFPVARTANLRRMAENGKAVVIPDTHRDPDWLKLEGARWVHSYVGAPVRLEGKTIGFLNLVSATAGFFSLAHAQRVQAFADQAAVAIKNAQLYHELENYSSFLEQNVRERTAELQRSTDYIATILDAVGDGLIVLRPDGIIQQVNPAFVQQTGYTSNDAVGRLYDELLGFEMKAKDDYWAALDALPRDKAWHGEASIRCKDGSYFDAALTISPVRDADGKIILLVSNIRDITPFKEVERAKDQFVSNVSHELRTPLTSIKLNHDLMRHNPQKLSVYLERTEREINRLNKLIENLLLLSRLDQERIELRLEPVDLTLLAAQYVEDRGPLAERRQLTLKSKTGTNLPLVEADEGLLGEALSVLLTNALNYTPAGGQVVVSTDTRNKEGQHWAGFSVSDTGPGIRREDRAQLFQRFFRGSAGRKSDAPGTGLGLAIAKEIAEQHGGQIEAVSEGMPGKGATFSIWLPVADDHPTDKGKNMASQDAGQRGD